MSNLFYLSQCWDCEKCSHESDCIRKNLTTEQQDAQTRSITCRRPFHDGEKIYQIEKKFHSLFVIKSGAVMLQTITEDGDLFITNFYFPGDIVGVDSIGSDYYRNDAIALEATTVCEIPYNQLEKLCFSTPSLHHDVITRLSS